MAGSLMRAGTDRHKMHHSVQPPERRFVMSRMNHSYAVLAGVLTIAAAATSLAAPPAAERHDEAIAIEGLLKTGWEVAGFTSTFDNRSAMILFRHPKEVSLVQCLTGYDVTRTPRTYTNCYRLR
jgi:hypothetical protein